MIKMNRVQKQYGDFRLDCTMEVPKDCITGLIGKNGAGKTTAFKSLLGLIRFEGEAEILGKHPSDLTPQDRERMGIVLADSGLNGYLSVSDYLPVLENLYHRFDRAAFVRRCEQFDIPMKKKIREFSTGMKRKLQVITALSYQAELLILDEPTAGMDVEMRDAILNLLREYMEQEGRAILISSHISSDLEGLCDDIYMIDNGKIVLHEDTDLLLSGYGILKLTPEQYGRIDRNGFLRVKQEDYGYCVLTKEKQFYLENYPQIVIENGGIDEVMRMMLRGEAAKEC